MAENGKRIGREWRRECRREIRGRRDIVKIKYRGKEYVYQSFILFIRGGGGGRCGTPPPPRPTVSVRPGGGGGGVFFPPPPPPLFLGLKQFHMGEREEL